jgi:hypothetical protein
VPVSGRRAAAMMTIANFLLDMFIVTAFVLIFVLTLAML